MPSSASPTSSTRAQCSCTTRPALRASASSDRRNSARDDQRGCSSFTATGASDTAWLARNTVPMPPLPSTPFSTNLPPTTDPTSGLPASTSPRRFGKCTEDSGSSGAAQCGQRSASVAETPSQLRQILDACGSTAVTSRHGATSRHDPWRGCNQLRQRRSNRKSPDTSPLSPGNSCSTDFSTVALVATGTRGHLEPTGWS